MSVRRLLLGVLLVALANEGWRVVDRRLSTYASIKVRWAASVTDDGRAALERDLGLRGATLDEGRVWAYRVYYPTREKLALVVRHEAVADTAYLDRSVYVPDRLYTDPPSRLAQSLRFSLWAAALLAAAAAAGVFPVLRGWLVATRAGATRSSVWIRGGGVAAARALLGPWREAALRVLASVTGLVTRRSRAVQACVLFAAGFVPVTAWSVAADARHPEWRRITVYQRGLPLPSSHEFLSQDPELLDHDVYYHGLYGWVEQARRADVVFTGNSRAVYAFRTEAVKPHFERLGLKYYNLAFAGGADKFPLTLMRRYDIWPKVLIINLHGFFEDDVTRFGVWAMERDWFTAWNFVWERQASWVLRYSLHQVLPHWRTLLAERRESQVIYRDVTDGSWRWVLPIVAPKPLGNLPVPRDPSNVAEREDIAKWNGRIARYAPGYLAELASRGTKVVLVYVPWTEPVAYYSALESAQALGKPLVVAWPDGLMGAVGSHMGLDDARRYMDALMPRLLATDEFRALVPVQANVGRR